MVTDPQKSCRILRTVVVTALLFLQGTMGQIAPEAKLWNHLMTSTGYNKNTRPVLGDPNKQMEVSFFFSLARLESLNEKTQVMTTFGWMGALWKDELLRWDPALFNGLYKLVVPGDQIWLPEIAMLNSVEQGNDLSMTSEFRAAVFADGTVSWAPGFKWQTSCTVDLVSFPYDTQVCSVTFVNWVYQGQFLNFTIANPIVDVNSYEPNGEWDLLEGNVTREDLEPGQDFLVPSITFTLKLRRKPDFFEANVVIPSLIMTILSALVFYLPAESGEKIGLGITVLLSFSVVLLMVSDITPRSNSMPLITIFIVLSMGLTSLSLIGTIVVLNVFHHHPEKPVPRFLRATILNGIARCLCMKDKESTGDAMRVHPTEKDTKTGGGQDKDMKIQDIDGYQTKTGIVQTGTSSIPQEIIDYFQRMREKEDEDSRVEANRAEWQRLSSVLDRLFFCIYLIVLIVVGIILTTMIVNSAASAEQSLKK